MSKSYYYYFFFANIDKYFGLLKKYICKNEGMETLFHNPDLCYKSFF